MSVEQFGDLPNEEKLNIIAEEETRLRSVFAEYPVEQLEITAKRNRVSLVGGRTTVIDRLVRFDLRRCYGASAANWDSTVDGVGTRESLTPSEATVTDTSNEVDGLSRNSTIIENPCDQPRSQLSLDPLAYEWPSEKFFQHSDNRIVPTPMQHSTVLPESHGSDVNIRDSRNLGTVRCISQPLPQNQIDSESRTESTNIDSRNITPLNSGSRKEKANSINDTREHSSHRTSNLENNRRVDLPNHSNFPTDSRRELAPYTAPYPYTLPPYPPFNPCVPYP